MRKELFGYAIAMGLSIGLSLPVLAETPVAGGKLTIELNKFEQINGGGCRAYFLFRNHTGTSFQGFQMSLAVLNKAGVIEKLLSVDAAPLPVARTTLKLFDIPKLSCGDIGQVLLHDIPICRPQNGKQMNCFPLLKLKSLTTAQLVE